MFMELSMRSPTAEKGKSMPSATSSSTLADRYLVEGGKFTR